MNTVGSARGGVAIVAGVLAAHVLCALAADNVPAAGKPVVNIGICTSIVRGVNENDARAAMRGWAEIIMRQMQPKASYTTTVLSPEALLAQVRQGLLQVFAVSTPELSRFLPYMDPRNIVLDDLSTKGGYEYLILVRNDSGLRNIRDLKGRKLVTYMHSTMSVATSWLDVFLDSEGLPLANEYFSPLSESERLSRGVVLPVFFKQMDACLVSRPAFETMVELNPQLGKQLQPIVVSQRLIPSAMVFHKDYDPTMREALVSMLQDLYKIEVGKQMHTLFGFSRYIASEAAMLKPTQELLARAVKIRSRKGGSK